MCKYTVFYLSLISCASTQVPPQSPPQKTKSWRQPWRWITCYHVMACVMWCVMCGWHCIWPGKLISLIVSNMCLQHNALFTNKLHTLSILATQDTTGNLPISRDTSVHPTAEHIMGWPAMQMYIVHHYIASMSWHWMSAKINAKFMVISCKNTLSRHTVWM